MNKDALFLFLVLLIALVLCSFFGVNCGSKEGLTGAANYTCVNTIASSGATGPKYTPVSNIINSIISGATGPKYTPIVSSSATYRPIVSSGATGPKYTPIVSSSATYTPIISGATGPKYAPIVSSGATGPKYTPSTSKIISGATGPKHSHITSKIISGATGPKYTPIVSSGATGPSNTPIVSSGATGPSNTSNYDYYNHFSRKSTVVTNGTIFYGPNGSTAIIVTNGDGTQYIKLTQTSGSKTLIFKQTSKSTFTGPPGFTCTIVNGNIQFTEPNGNKILFTPNPSYGSTGGTSEHYQPNKTQTVTIFTDSIQPGREDLYILKTKIVPPICPVCQNQYQQQFQTQPQTSSSNESPPCPTCARYPEPGFESNQMSNYRSMNNSFLPRPVLNDFSAFGM